MTTRFFPEYLPDPEKESNPTPAIIEDNKIYTLTESWDIREWKQARKVIVTNELVCFSSSTSRLRFLSDIRTDGRCTIRDSTEWFQVCINVGGVRYWIVDTKQWGKENADSRFLTFIESVFNHCLGFRRATPASLGKRLMLETFLQNERERKTLEIFGIYKAPLRKHPLPSKPCRMDIKDNLTGGRVECFQDVLPGYTKLDMDSALVNHFRSLPTGIAHRFIENQLLLPPSKITLPSRRTHTLHSRNEWDTEYQTTEKSTETKNYYDTWNQSTIEAINRLGATFYGKVIVSITSELPLGPFPCRIPSLHWPRTTGLYKCWLWKEQIMDTLASGCAIMLQEGWYWRYFTEDMKAWRELMLALRNTSPNSEVAKAIKRISSAAISCMGIGDARYYHAPQSEYEEGDYRLYDSKGPLNTIVKTDRNSNRPTPVHWYSYTWMQVSRTLYRMALPHAQANQLVALHTDAMYLKEPVERMDGWKLEVVGK